MGSSFSCPPLRLYACWHTGMAVEMLLRQGVGVVRRYYVYRDVWRRQREPRGRVLRSAVNGSDGSAALRSRSPSSS